MYTYIYTHTCPRTWTIRIPSAAGLRHSFRPVTAPGSPSFQLLAPGHTGPQRHCATPAAGTDRCTHIQSCLGLLCSTHMYVAPRPLHLLTGPIFCYCFHSQLHIRTRSECCTRDARVSGLWSHSNGWHLISLTRVSPGAGTQARRPCSPQSHPSC